MYQIFALLWVLLKHEFTVSAITDKKMLGDLIIFLFAGWPKVRLEREFKDNCSQKSITKYNVFPL